MNLITYQHSGAYFIQVQSIQKQGLRYTLHSSTNFIRRKRKRKSESKFHHHQNKWRQSKKKKRKYPHSWKGWIYQIATLKSKRF